MAAEKKMKVDRVEDLIPVTEILRLPEGVHVVIVPGKNVRVVVWAKRVFSGQLAKMAGVTIITVEGKSYDVASFYLEQVETEYYRGQRLRPAPVFVQDYIQINRIRHSDGRFWILDYTVLNRGSAAEYPREMPPGVWTNTKSQPSYIVETLEPRLRLKLEPYDDFFGEEKIVVSDYNSFLEMPLGKKVAWVRGKITRISPAWGPPTNYPKYVDWYKDEKDKTKPETRRYGVELYIWDKRAMAEIHAKIWRPTAILFEVKAHVWDAKYSSMTDPAADALRKELFQKIMSRTYLFELMDKKKCPVPDTRPCVNRFMASDSVHSINAGPNQEEGYSATDMRTVRHS